MRKVHAIIFISFIIISMFSISGITAPNEKLKIYFAQVPTFYSGDSGEFTITFDNTSNSNLKAVYIYLKDEFFEFSKNKFFYGEIEPGQKINEKISYTVKNIDKGNYLLKANTQYSYQVFCSGLKCDYTSEGFLVEIPFKVEGVMSPMIDIKPRNITVNKVPYILPLFFVNKGSAVENSYVILNQEGSLFSFDYTEEVGPIQSLTKKEITITKIPENAGEYTVFINLEIKDTNGKTSFLKFPFKIKVEGSSIPKTSFEANSTQIVTNENNNSEAPITNPPKSKTKSSLFYIQEAVLVITLFALVVTFFLMLLSRR